MGGGRDARCRGLARTKTDAGGRPAPIGLGGRIPIGGFAKSRTGSKRLAAAVRGGTFPGSGGALGAVVGKGAGAVGSGARPTITEWTQPFEIFEGLVQAPAFAFDAGGFRIGICRGVRFMGRDELDADAGSLTASLATL